MSALSPELFMMAANGLPFPDEGQSLVHWWGERWGVDDGCKSLVLIDSFVCMIIFQTIYRPRSVVQAAQLIYDMSIMIEIVV